MKNASIEIIHSITAHPNADSLLCAKVLAWPVVIKKDAGYKENDLVIFIPIDTIVPSDNPAFAFMERAKWRTWSARFRGEISSGLVMPIQVAIDKGLRAEDAKEGLDVGDLLGCKHYEKPIDVRIAGEVKGNFPTKFTSITDEDNLLSNPNVVNEFMGLTCYISGKQDGSSLTIIRNNEETHVCSRRLSLKDGDNAFWNVVKKYSVLEKLDAMKLNVVIQAECCGPKMNGNRLELSDLDMFVFNVKTLDNMEYAGLAGVQSVAASLGLKTVPILQTFRWDETWSIDRLREIANNLKYPNGKPAEGIVVRPILSRYSKTLGKMLSVKIINENYKD